MNRLQTRELAITNQMRFIDQACWETDNVDRLTELRLERAALERELSQLRLTLYGAKRSNEQPTY